MHVPCQCFKKKWLYGVETAQECSESGQFLFARDAWTFNVQCFSKDAGWCHRKYIDLVSSALSFCDSLNILQPIGSGRGILPCSASVLSRCYMPCLPPGVVMKHWRDKLGAHTLSAVLLEKWVIVFLCFGRSLPASLCARMSSTKGLLSWHTSSTLPDRSLGAAIRASSICSQLQAPVSGSKFPWGEE